MIEKISGNYIPICDICGKELEGENDFYDAIKSKQDNGWKGIKQGKEWIDVCAECQKLK